jgi:hypothetical protein
MPKSIKQLFSRFRWRLEFHASGNVEPARYLVTREIERRIKGAGFRLDVHPVEIPAVSGENHTRVDSCERILKSRHHQLETATNQQVLETNAAQPSSFVSEELPTIPRGLLLSGRAEIKKPEFETHGNAIGVLERERTEVLVIKQRFARAVECGFAFVSLEPPSSTRLEDSQPIPITNQEIDSGYRPQIGRRVETRRRRDTIHEQKWNTFAAKTNRQLIQCLQQFLIPGFGIPGKSLEPLEAELGKHGLERQLGEGLENDRSQRVPLAYPYQLAFELGFDPGGDPRWRPLIPSCKVGQCLENEVNGSHDFLRNQTV